MRRPVASTVRWPAPIPANSPLNHPTSISEVPSLVPVSRPEMACQACQQPCLIQTAKPRVPGSEACRPSPSCMLANSRRHASSDCRSPSLLAARSPPFASLAGRRRRSSSWWWPSLAVIVAASLWPPSVSGTAAF